MLKPIRRLAGAVLLSILAPDVAAPQALPSLTLLRVQYNTRKVTLKPEGELKAQIDALDKQIEQATRLGQNGELRRLLAKGTTLLAGKPWTEELDFATSLVLRADRIVADSTKPFAARLEQIYSPSIVLQRQLTARVLLRRSGRATFLGSPPAEEVVKELSTLDGVGRDLRESPYRIRARRVGRCRRVLPAERGGVRSGAVAGDCHARHQRCTRGSTRSSRGSRRPRRD